MLNIERNNSHTLQELFDFLKGKKVFVQTHNFPDPDAIGAAFGLQQLLLHFGIESTLCYHGKIDRLNTRKMVEYLGIDNPSNALSFAVYLKQLRHNQKLHETTGLQNWCAIANLMGISAQALMLPECQDGFKSDFWTQTIRDELRSGCAVMASFNHQPVRIVAVEADGVRMDNQIAEISETLIPFEKLQTSGLQWVIGLNDSNL